MCEIYPQIAELEDEKRDLEKNVNELKAKCDQIEKRAQEQRQVEEKKHTEEIQFLKRTNQQLKVWWTVILGSFINLVIIYYCGQLHLQTAALEDGCS